MPPHSDIRPVEVTPTFRELRARSPLSFGNAVVERLTYCVAEARVENRRGSWGIGHGGILLSDFWAFPDARVSHQVREQAMMDVARRFCRLASEFDDFLHPLDLYFALEDELADIGRDVSEAHGLPSTLPPLARLVAASPVDAALHDAFGIANRIDTYDGYGPASVGHDLSAYLGEMGKGCHVSDFLREDYTASLPAFHLVGGLDTLRKENIPAESPRDGLPNSLEGWMERDGLNCLKVKLKGTDVEWDLSRLMDVYAVAAEVQGRTFSGPLTLSLDPNEQCESPRYMVELLRRLEEQEPGAFESIRYVEQPTARNLRDARHDMGPLAELKPVLIDESLTSLADFELAMELNWSGVALKTCKGHSWALLLAARAALEGAPYAVQDLTNPGISLVHSAGLAARLEPISGLETNCCQFFPRGHESIRGVHGGLARRRKGSVTTDSIRGPGLGLRWEDLAPPRG